MTFEQELQELMNKHPEVGEVEVSYRTKKVFKTTLGGSSGIASGTAKPAALQGVSSEIEKAAEMIRKGEL